MAIWTLQAGIFPENTASIRLHEKHGFRIIGVRERIGKNGWQMERYCHNGAPQYNYRY